MSENVTLAKIIVATPIPINKEDVLSYESMITQADDEYLVFDQSNGINKPILYGGFAGILLICIMLPSAINSLDVIIIILGLLPGSLLLMVFSAMGAKDKYVFDRQSSTVSYVDFFFKTRTQPFSEADFISKRFNNGSEMLGILSANKVTWKNIIFADFKSDQMWSTLVWYMDTNRSLPPGTAFDSYREKDYNRRQSAGFPAPLYPSAIPMPDNKSKDYTTK